MLAEYLIPDDKVWAVHAYVVNTRGDVVWGLHLNSHFDIFTHIDPRTPSGGTDVLLAYLRSGWPVTSAQCVAHTEDADSTIVQAGVVHDFETELPSGTDDYKVPLGFSTFSDGSSPATISAAVDTWTSRDWSAHDGFSFWLYGSNSGRSLFVDVLDNRKRCSTYDDSERYTYRFTDDFSGWKQVAVQFSDMVRKEIGNSAPNDGLGLSEVHGWGLGATSTGGQTTYYIDDFELQGKP